MKDDWDYFLYEDYDNAIQALVGFRRYPFRGGKGKSKNRRFGHGKGKYRPRFGKGKKGKSKGKSKGKPKGKHFDRHRFRRNFSYRSFRFHAFGKGKSKSKGGKFGKKGKPFGQKGSPSGGGYQGGKGPSGKSSQVGCSICASPNHRSDSCPWRTSENQALWQTAAAGASHPWSYFATGNSSSSSAGAAGTEFHRAE